MTESDREGGISTLVVGILAASFVLVGIASLVQQFVSLRRRLKKKSRVKQSITQPTKDDLVELKKEFRISQARMNREIESEMESMRKLQNEVSAQLVELKDVMTKLVSVQNNQNPEQKDVAGSVRQGARDDAKIE